MIVLKCPLYASIIFRERYSCIAYMNPLLNIDKLLSVYYFRQSAIHYLKVQMDIAPNADIFYILQL
jgi:hypothetical protein